jgi:dTDP-3-amino-2,3,6-trideoxy-4-keto-D-glucose/dTDP-3-amino-3,4,6-trideoxy-alpha-D-glucose/dTDP-2,6-dideoxy-D-kanosamine transaminase
MTIKTWDYLKEYSNERNDILAAVDRVFSSGQLILGNSVKFFEEEFANFCDSSFGVGVDNATNGIFLSLKALNIGNNDEVITVANTAVPTVSAIVQAGATPTFVDVDPRTALMDVSLLEDRITEKTRCIIPVHLYGQCVDMAPLLALAKKYELKIVEDCSQSHGATQNGKKCGSFGDLGVFSFYPTKILGGYGDGGLITTNSEILNERLRSLRFYGMRGSYYAEEVGYNSRLDEVHAEILRYKLKKLDHAIDLRRKLADKYKNILAQSEIQLPCEATGNRHAFYLYVVSHPERDRIMAELKKANISLSISYPWPIHTMRAYQNLGYKEGDFPVTEALSKSIFSLPMYPCLEEEEVLTVCKNLMRAL